MSSVCSVCKRIPVGAALPGMEAPAWWGRDEQVFIASSTAASISAASYERSPNRGAELNAGTRHAGGHGEGGMGLTSEKKV